MEKINKFLIMLAYYERPKVVINALNSILNLNYSNFEVHFIDDGSQNKGEPIVREICASIIDKFKFDYIENTIEQKKAQGGSIHGKYLNKAMQESDADHVIILCDDDAIYPDFLTKLNVLLNEENNKDKKYFYHKVLRYDSINESYTEGINRNDLSFYTNQWDIPINCAKKVDASQVTFSRQHFLLDGISFPYPQTSGLDESIYNQMYVKWGECYPSNLIGQIKSDNFDNLCYKIETDEEFITHDSRTN